jgi:hypothetical protein
MNKPKNQIDGTESGKLSPNKRSIYSVIAFPNVTV